jgi:hypothetical protein
VAEERKARLEGPIREARTGGVNEVAAFGQLVKGHDTVGLTGLFDLDSFSGVRQPLHGEGREGARDVPSRR